MNTSLPQMRLPRETFLSISLLFVGTHLHFKALFAFSLDHTVDWIQWQKYSSLVTEFVYTLNFKPDTFDPLSKLPEVLLRHFC